MAYDTEPPAKDGNRQPPPAAAGNQEPTAGEQPPAAAQTPQDSADANAPLRERLVSDVMTTLCLGPYVPLQVYERRCAAVDAAIDQTAPANEIEGMLTAQLVAAYSRGMGFIRKSLTEEYIDERVRCAYILAATRLLSLHRRQLAALNRQREWNDEWARRAQDRRRKRRKLRKPPEWDQ